tara:strand:- start:3411 stop:4457 length:1047 start_codon:yes stop_codon:yes gene_type:complete
MAEEAVNYEVEDNENWGEIKPGEEQPKEVVEYEIEDEEKPSEQSLSDETEVVEEKPLESQPSELKGVETKGAQKRIRQLIKQRKDREDRIGELEARVSDYENKLKQKDNEIVSTYKKNLDSNESQVNNQIILAESAYKKALEAGEADEIVAAQRHLNRAELQLDNVSKAKNAYEDYEVTAQQQGQQQPVQQQPTSPNPANYDPKAVQWATENNWFGQDQIMTAAAIAIDEQLKGEGFDPTDDEFYEEIDMRLQQSFPAKFKQEKAPEEPSQDAEMKEPEQPSQVVSGASRTVANPKTSRSNNKVKLTRDDIEMANRWGIPLERYAEQKLVANKAEGEYTTIITSKRGG